MGPCPTKYPVCLVGHPFSGLGALIALHGAPPPLTGLGVRWPPLANEPQRERVIRGEQTVAPNESGDSGDNQTMSFFTDEGFSDPNPTTNRWVKYFTCVRLDNKLICNGPGAPVTDMPLAEKLGLFEEEECARRNEMSQVDKFRNFKDAAGFGLFSEITFTIKPVGGGVGIAPFFTSYTSYAPYSSTLSFETAKSRVRDHEFKFGSPDAIGLYKADPNSIRVKRTRNNRGGDNPQLNCFLSRSLLPNFLRNSLQIPLILNHNQCLAVLDPPLLPSRRPPSIRHIENTLLRLCHKKGKMLRMSGLGV